MLSNESKELSLFYVIGNYSVIFLLHKKRSAKDAHLAERKLAASDTARARKSPASGLFILVPKGSNISILHQSLMVFVIIMGKHHIQRMIFLYHLLISI